MHGQVDTFLSRAPRWRDEMSRLRAIALDCGLIETFKWGKPCYGTAQGNVAIVQPFKDSCAFMFFKGMLLDDATGLLETQGPNSQSSLRAKFTSLAQVEQAEDALRGLIRQAMTLEQAGTKVVKAPAAEVIPEELSGLFAAVSGLQAAFNGLTPGRRRAYLMHFGAARQARTRTARIERCVPQILAGKGLDD